MAYRRKHSMTRSTTFEDHRPFSDELPSSPTILLASQAIRASAAHRDSSLSSAFGDQVTFSASSRDHHRTNHPKESATYEYTSMKRLHEPKSEFWSVLARKAKSILEDANETQQSEDGNNRPQGFDSTSDQLQSRWLTDNYQTTENQMSQKRSDAITSSLRDFGGTIRKSFEEGLTIVENRTADIIQETKKLQIKRNTRSPDASSNVSLIQTEYETQLKNSRDVANAMAAKTKLLLRELKTLKADLAFVKERSTQLEEENKILRESRQKGSNPADDDLIMLQLETLLAEKARLAHENSVYARENRFLREIVEYHQLTMQDVVYLDEGNEEVGEVYPVHQFSTLSSPARSESDMISPAVPCSRSSTPNRWLSPSPSTLVLSASPTSHQSPPRNKAFSVALDTGLSPPSPKVGVPLQRCSSTPSS